MKKVRKAKKVVSKKRVSAPASLWFKEHSYHSCNSYLSDDFRDCVDMGVPVCSIEVYDLEIGEVRRLQRWLDRHIAWSEQVLGRRKAKEAKKR